MVSYYIFIVRFLLCIFFFFSLPECKAQLFSKERVQNFQNFDKKRVSFGFFLGFNTYDFNFDYSTDRLDQDVIHDESLGFNVGLLSNLRINDYLDLRLEPMVIFNTRNLTFDNPLLSTEFERFREVKSTYVHIPLLLKISTKRLNNFKPFIIGGVSTSINLSSNQDNPEDNASGQFRMKTSTNYYEIGFGIDFYLFYFKFTPSIRGVFAMSDELVRDNDPNSPYTATIDKMSTRGVFINFTFQ